METKDETTASTALKLLEEVSGPNCSTKDLQNLLSVKYHDPGKVKAIRLIRSIIVMINHYNRSGRDHRCGRDCIVNVLRGITEPYHKEPEEPGDEPTETNLRRLELANQTT